LTVIKGGRRRRPR